jgi:hypothetical protein
MKDQFVPKIACRRRTRTPILTQNIIWLGGEAWA